MTTRHSTSSDRDLDRTGEPEATDGDTRLAQRIWGRYGGAPGVIPLAATLGLAGRVAGLSTGRLPLLADVQRRWAPASDSFPGGPSALPYARPPVVTGVLSPSSDPVLPVSEAPPRKLGPAGPTLPEAGQAALWRTPSALPAVGAQQPRLAARAGQPGAQDETGVPTATNTRDLGTTTLQRYMDSPAGRPAGRTAANGRPRARPPSSPGVDALHPVTGAGRQVADTGSKASAASSSGDLGTAILQRYLDSPAGRVMQYVFASPERERPRERTTANARQRARALRSPGEGAPRPGPAPGAGQPGAEAETASPTATGTGDLGITILRRHLGGPAGWTMRQVFAPPEPGGMAGHAVASMWQRATGTVALTAGVPLPVDTPQTGRGTFASPPSSRQGQHAPITALPGTVVSSPATIQRQMDEAGSPVTAGPRRISKMRVQGGDWTSILSLSKDAGLQRPRPSTGPGRFDVTADTTPLEMPLVRAVGHSAGEARDGGAMPIQAWTGDGPGTRLVTSVQRAAANTPAATPATEAAGAGSSAFAEGPSPPTAAQSILESPDLDRLAREVYALIEQRLTIERESLGL